MARKPRIHLPGGLYHVMFRGNGGLPVFLTDDDRYRFYLLLQEGTSRFGFVTGNLKEPFSWPFEIVSSSSDPFSS